MAKKEDKKRKTRTVKTKFRTRSHKRRGSKGGASDTRFYPKYGDEIDNLCRLLPVRKKKKEETS